MKDIDICYGYYASHWGLTDFYEESNAKLVNVLNSGEDFDTGWFGCKKEINYARICRDGDTLIVQVSAHMDDLWEEDDLIYDALWEECHTEEELPECILESIRDEAIDVGIDERSEAEETLPADASFEDILAVIERLEGEAMNSNTEMYKQLRAIVKAHYEYMKGEKING